MRSVPLVTARALEAQTSDDPLIVFVTIAHETLDAPIRLVLDGADHLRSGALHHKSAFELALLSDDDSPPVTRFTFPAVDRQALTRLAGVTEPATVSFEVLASSAFDQSTDPRQEKPDATAIYSATHLFLTEINVDAMSCEGTLRSWDYRQEAWPNLRATQAIAPGAWL